MSELHGHFRLQLGDFELDAEFSIADRGITALFGPSGSGKSTLLRCLAGLQCPDQAYLKVGDEVWQDTRTGFFLPPHRRSLGYVFQQPSLFPHLSIQQNLEFGWRRVQERDRQVDFNEMVHLLGIQPLLGRMPRGLSGGEQQRVAIVRALLTSPRLLLMDEPVSALDQASKQAILPYLERLHDELALPVIYVSHSIDEVARLCDGMLLIDQGRILDQGPLAEMLTRLDLPLSHADTASAVLETRIEQVDTTYHLTTLTIPGEQIIVGRETRHAVGERQRLLIHARDVSIAMRRCDDSSILNILPARVEQVSPVSDSQLMVKLAVGEQGACHLLSRITRKSGDKLQLVPGKQVYAQIKSIALLE